MNDVHDTLLYNNIYIIKCVKFNLYYKIDFFFFVCNSICIIHVKKNYTPLFSTMITFSATFLNCELNNKKKK
jgi:hypothetical protein